jgi:endonuclease/exonuclease/phosphatase family metal-dependent hydrolase
MKTYLRLLVATALFAPVLALGTQGSAVAVGTTVRIATFNVQVRRSVAEFEAGVLPLLDRSDIVGLQEMDTREKEAVLASLSDSGWAHYTVRPAFQTPVLWRTDRFSFVSGRVAKISDATYIGGELPGEPSVQKARYVSVVRLRDRLTGHNVSIINAHMIQGAIRGGRPWVGRPRVWGLYKVGLLNLASITAAEQRWGRVFTLGDFNSGWVADHKHLLRRFPIRTFSRLSMRSMWAASRPTNGLGTHNDALIDQVFSNIRPSSARVQFDLSGHSDHRPAIVWYPTT